MKYSEDPPDLLCGVFLQDIYPFSMTCLTSFIVPFVDCGVIVTTRERGNEFIGRKFLRDKGRTEGSEKK